MGKRTCSRAIKRVRMPFPRLPQTHIGDSLQKTKIRLLMSEGRFYQCNVQIPLQRRIKVGVLTCPSRLLGGPGWCPWKPLGSNVLPVTSRESAWELWNGSDRPESITRGPGASPAGRRPPPRATLPPRTGLAALAGSHRPPGASAAASPPAAGPGAALPAPEQWFRGPVPGSRRPSAAGRSHQRSARHPRKQDAGGSRATRARPLPSRAPGAHAATRRDPQEPRARRHASMACGRATGTQVGKAQQTGGPASCFSLEPQQHRRWTATAASILIFRPRHVRLIQVAWNRQGRTLLRRFLRHHWGPASQRPRAAAAGACSWGPEGFGKMVGVSAPVSQQLGAKAGAPRREGHGPRGYAAAKTGAISVSALRDVCCTIGSLWEVKDIRKVSGIKGVSSS
jgi:hypothetical protein